MSKPGKIFGIFLMAVILCGGSFFIGMRVKASDNLENKINVFLQVLDIVRNDYVEKDLDDTKLVYGSIKGLLESLDDPYSRFMEPKAYQEMKMRMSGSYGGIGIYLGMKDKQLTVISPIPGTPADKVGLKARDKIVAIDGKSTKDMSLEEAISLIRGPKGTPVKLSILRGKAKEPKEYVIIRKIIVIKSVEKKVLNDNLGYIKLNTFENLNAASEMEKALKEMNGKKVAGLILDLRKNGGGLLQNAIEIGSMFIKEGAIVSTVDREGKRSTVNASGKAIWDRPLVVLIDDSSASAAEILAGALKDDQVGTLVGTHTFGKASVQNIRQLEDKSAVLITVAKYFTPSGQDISKKGVEPDVKVEIPKTELETLEAEEEPKEILEKDDLQLQKAIEILKGKIAQKQ